MTAARWWHWQDWSLGAKSAAAVALPLTLLLVALGFSYRLQQAISAADADVRRALAIQADIQSLHSLIAESATGVRGYLLTGRDEFLVPYRNARRELPFTLTSLRRNIRDPEMKTHLAHIQDLLQRKLDSLEELRERGRLLTPADLQAHLLGSKGLLDELRAEIRAMSVREADLVAEYSAAAALALRRNLWVDGITTALTLATGLGAFLLLLSGVVRRVQRLTVNAERLAHGEPLEALPAGRDEVGLLADRLQNASLLLASRAAAARAASEAKSQFLSRTSHELRTPLNAILGFAQLLEADARDSRQAAQIAHILSAGRHLLNLIDEVLDIARIESRELQLSLSAQPLMTLATEARDMVAPLADQHRIAIHLAPELEGITVEADPQRLRQVLLNLLSNAVKYNRPGGSVAVTACRRDAEVEIAVEDNGIGIPRERLQRLFTPFDRLDAELGPVEGTGLGLALSQHLMQCMGGHIDVTSASGKGSRFVLRLKGAAVMGTSSTTAMAEPVPASPDPKPASSHCVLVIEDQASNLALIQAVLVRRPAWRLATACNGIEGLQLAKERKPDLILLDLHLPGMNGEEVLAELRSDPDFATTGIVIVSADAVPATIERLKAAGASDYLTKPIAVPKLLALLDKAP